MLAAPAPAGAAQALTLEAARTAVIEAVKGDLHRYPDYYRVEGGPCWRLSTESAVACRVSTYFGADTVCAERMVAYRDPVTSRVEVDSMDGRAECRPR